MFTKNKINFMFCGKKYFGKLRQLNAIEKFHARKINKKRKRGVQEMESNMKFWRKERLSASYNTKPIEINRPKGSSKFEESNIKGDKKVENKIMNYQIINLLKYHS